MAKILLVFTYADGIESAEIEEVVGGLGDIHQMVEEDIEYAKEDHMDLRRVDIFVYTPEESLPARFVHIKTVEVPQ